MRLQGNRLALGAPSAKRSSVAFGRSSTPRRRVRSRPASFALLPRAAAFPTRPRYSLHHGAVHPGRRAADPPATRPSPPERGTPSPPEPRGPRGGPGPGRAARTAAAASRRTAGRRRRHQRIPGETPASTSIADRPASTNPSPPGVTGICPSAFAPQNASRTRPASDASRSPPAPPATSRSRTASVPPRPPAPASSAPRRSRGSARARPEGARAAPRAAAACAAAGSAPSAPPSPPTPESAAPTGASPEPGQHRERHQPRHRGLQQAAYDCPAQQGGIASTGRASTTAKHPALTTASAPIAAGPGNPARTSSRYCNAAPTDPPPGATLVTALEARCAAITGRHRAARNAIRCNSTCTPRPPPASRTWPPASRGEAGDLPPGTERLEHLGEDHVQLHQRQRQPDHVAHQPPRP